MKISELVQDPRNANRGTQRGRDVVGQSLKDLGAGRSVLIDKNGVLIAGNKTAAAALAAGIQDDAIIVKTTGDQLVIVQRTDLDLSTDAKAKELAIADNRTSEIGLEWNPEVLAELSKEIDLHKCYFTDEEMGKLHPVEQIEALSDDQTGELSGTYSVLVNCDSEEAQLVLLKRMTEEGFTCRSLIA